MSAKGKKPKAPAAAKKRGKEELPIREKVQVPKPKGAVPIPVVSSRHGAEMITRSGRGFSFGELAAAQLQPSLARRWGLPIDLRRRSVLDGNVASVKKWSPPAMPKAKEEGEVKKLEEELVKVEKEVKTEVKKEAAKVKKEVKKEVKKVEKEAVEKVEKPVKARARKKPKPKKST